MKETTIKKKASIVWIYTTIIFLALFIAALMFDLGYIVGIRSNRITPRDIDAAAKVIGLEFNSQEIKLMLPDVKENAAAFKKLRHQCLDNSEFPALIFYPLLLSPQELIGLGKVDRTEPALITLPETVIANVPQNIEDLAFAPITTLAPLLRSRQITSSQLTQMYIKRLKRYDPILKCVITLCEDRALKQAHQADQEIAAGNYRGPLHGIPWGVKDLFAVKGIKTTWGATPYKDQVIDIDATVVERLDAAGAVLVAKLTTGALAWGDVWFGGKTRNPWNFEQGSSGSSAGPASATAAGLVGFAIGTETWGSIISPSTRCGVTGLRPSFGSVSRYGCMALSWSMDKAGPICRSAEDCALVFNAIYGTDGKDIACIPRSFNWDRDIDIKTLRIGYLKSLFESDYDEKTTDTQTLKTLRGMGIELIPLELPKLPVDALSFILNAEAAAAFDPLTRSNRDDLMVRQIRYAWPNVFRHSRLIPAVEYIQANRYRTRLIRDMAKILKDIDVYIAPSFVDNHLLLTNLTGHPAVVLPNGFNEKGEPLSITFMGNLFQEARLLAVARAYQEVVDFHKKYPPLDKNTPESKQSSQENE